MSNDRLKETFFAECEDLLDALSEGVAAMADATSDNETINAIFRAVHSIKGAAGAFALTDLVNFAHKFETVLDMIRSDKIEVDADLLRVIQRSSDVLADLVEAAQFDSGNTPEAMNGLIEALSEIAESTAKDGAEEEEFVFEALSLDTVDAGQVGATETFLIHFAPEPALFENGHDPRLLFATLREMGVLKVTCDSSAVPPLTELNIDEFYLAWDLTLEAAITEGEIRNVFVFVDGLCDLQITRQAPDEVPDVPFADSPAIEAIAAPSPEADQKAPPETAPKPSPATANANTNLPTLRVDPERVDRLINTVGELIINQAVVAQKVLASGVAPNSELMADLDDYRYLAREIQEGVMAIRAQPVKPLFQRMGRIVREAAESLGKDVILVTDGEGTEVDKTLVERLADPLTHMVRNAVDHGIESAAARSGAGKPPQGTVRLSAAHRSGHVLIEISDDGAGLNRAKILEIAVGKGLVSPEAKLTDSEIDNLLFMPGFSTAEKVTNLSGRGVGMDVVKTAITSLGGRVSISSRPGKGSTFSISLPLTLAVLDGMVVTVQGETMVLPLSSIVETIRPKAADVTPFGKDGHLLKIRGAYVPVVSLASVLGFNRCELDPSKSILVLTRSEGHEPVALAVEAISDQRQVVIKSLEGNYGAIPGVSAATILGDGKIALIVDTDAVVTMANQRIPAAPVQELEVENE